MLAEGLITAMVTPFKDDHIDEQATRNLIERLIQKGVDGIFILGTNGEFHVMSKEEKIAFAHLVVECVDQRVPVYAGSGGNSTKEVLELSLALETTGIQALSIITPYLVPLHQNELVHHYKTIANAVHVPVILYNIPKNTGNNLDVETVAKLAKHPNIIGVKDSSGNIEQIKGYIKATKGEDFAVLSGSDSLILQAMMQGAKGAIAATSNLLTDIDVNIIRQYKMGNFNEAERYQQAIEPLRKVLKLGSVPSVLKASMNLADIQVGDCRKPVDMPDVAITHKIKEMLENYTL